MAVTTDDRDDLGPERLEADDAVECRVDRRAVRARDVDPEVEAFVHPLRRHPDARVAEEPPHGVLLVERLDRPAVGGRADVDAAAVSGTKAALQATSVATARAVATAQS